VKKLFDKDEIWFAVLWIVIYVIGFSNADALSVSVGVPKLLTVFVGLILSLLLYSFIKSNQLLEYFGLCAVKGNYRNYLYFVPLVLLTSVNLWNGITCNYPITETVLHIASMCFVGFLEEVIFRGLLFKGMCRMNATAAIIVSSLAFGMGHIINLLLGEPIFETLLQLVYASAIGFCYTAIFYVSGSILPCVISHASFNSLSAFAVQPADEANLIITFIMTVSSIGYGAWLLCNDKQRKTADKNSGRDVC